MLFVLCLSLCLFVLFIVLLFGALFLYICMCVCVYCRCVLFMLFSVYCMFFLFVLFCLLRLLIVFVLLLIVISCSFFAWRVAFLWSFLCLSSYLFPFVWSGASVCVVVYLCVYGRLFLKCDVVSVLSMFALFFCLNGHVCIVWALVFLCFWILI